MDPWTLFQSLKRVLSVLIMIYIADYCAVLPHSSGFDPELRLLSGSGAEVAQ